MVNVIGYLIIGFLMGLSVRFSLFDNEQRFLLITGLCGGFTTFSTFSSENMELFETRNYWTLTLYVAGSIILVLVAVWGGNVLSEIKLTYYV